MRILKLTNKAPYPPTDGASVGMYNMCCGLLLNGIDVTLLSINTRKHFKSDTNVDPDFKKKCHYQTVYKKTDVTLVGAVANLFSPQSFFVSRFYFKEFEQKLIGILSENTFDIIQLESIFMGTYIPAIRKYSKAKISIRATNVEHIIWERAIANEKNSLKRAYLLLQNNRLKKFEKITLQSVDCIIPVTTIDKNYFENWGIKNKFYVSPTGLLLENHSQENIERIPNSVFHFGAMDWTPNEEAVLWFINEAWPLIKKEIPDATFYVVGGGLSAKIKAISVPGVIIVGFVKNISEAYSKYEVMVVPLLSGSGMRIKMIEGMLYGNPTVSTSIGAEGLNVTNEKNCLIADTPIDFANTVISILKDNNKKNRLSKEAIEFTRHHFDNTIITSRLISFYKSIL